jgi:hypothetical protein
MHLVFELLALQHVRDVLRTFVYIINDVISIYQYIYQIARCGHSGEDDVISVILYATHVWIFQDDIDLADKQLLIE